MAKILIAETDQISISTMNEALKTHEVEVFSELGPVLERLSQEPFDLFILDNALLDKSFGIWLEDFRKNCKVDSNKTIKIMILSFQDDDKKVKHYLKDGALDYVIKPVDKPLFMQKVGLLLATQEERQVYSFTTATPVDVAREVVMEEVSEFGLTLRTRDQFAEGDVVSFYSNVVFKTDARENVLARCYKITDNPDVKEEKLVSFAFVGVNQGTLKQIRTWMKQEYIRKKQKAA